MNTFLPTSSKMAEQSAGRWPPPFVLLLLSLPSPALCCHETKIVKQLGSPYSAVEDDDLANMAEADMPTSCQPGEGGGGIGKSLLLLFVAAVETAAAIVAVDAAVAVYRPVVATHLRLSPTYHFTNSVVMKNRIKHRKL